MYAPGSIPIMYYPLARVAAGGGTPPVSDLFLLLDGTDFLLLDSTNFLLLA